MPEPSAPHRETVVDVLPDKTSSHIPVSDPSLAAHLDVIPSLATQAATVEHAKPHIRRHPRHHSKAPHHKHSRSKLVHTSRSSLRHVVNAVRLALIVLWALVIAGTVALDIIADIFDDQSAYDKTSFPFGLVFAASVALNVFAALSTMATGYIRHRGFTFFQPFTGGQTFVLMQIAGYSTAVVALILKSILVQSGQTWRYGSFSILGVFTVTGQILLLLSINYFYSPLLAPGPVLKPTEKLQSVARSHEGIDSVVGDAETTTANASPPLAAATSTDAAHIYTGKDTVLRDTHRLSSWLSDMSTPPHRELAFILTLLVTMLISAAIAEFCAPYRHINIALSVTGTVTCMLIIHLCIARPLVPGYLFMVPFALTWTQFALQIVANALIVFSLCFNLVLHYAGTNASPSWHLTCGVITFSAIGLHLILLKLIGWHTPLYLDKDYNHYYNNSSTNSSSDVYVHRTTDPAKDAVEDVHSTLQQSAHVPPDATAADTAKHALRSYASHPMTKTTDSSHSARSVTQVHRYTAPLLTMLSVLLGTAIYGMVLLTPLPSSPHGWGDASTRQGLAHAQWLLCSVLFLLPCITHIQGRHLFPGVYEVWCPFGGNVEFVLLQAAGWTSCGFAMFFATLHASERSHQHFLLLFVALLMLAQVFLNTSLHVFDPHRGDKQRERHAGAALGACGDRARRKSKAALLYEQRTAKHADEDKYAHEEQSDEVKCAQLETAELDTGKDRNGWFGAQEEHDDVDDSDNDWDEQYNEEDKESYESSLAFLLPVVVNGEMLLAIVLGLVSMLLRGLGDYIALHAHTPHNSHATIRVHSTHGTSNQSRRGDVRHSRSTRTIQPEAVLLSSSWYDMLDRVMADIPIPTLLGAATLLAGFTAPLAQFSMRDRTPFLFFDHRKRAESRQHSLCAHDNKHNSSSSSNSFNSSDNSTSSNEWFGDGAASLDRRWGGSASSLHAGLQAVAWLLNTLLLITAAVEWYSEGVTSVLHLSTEESYVWMEYSYHGFISLLPLLCILTGDFFETDALMRARRTRALARRAVAEIKMLILHQHSNNKSSNNNSNDVDQVVGQSSSLSSPTSPTRMMERLDVLLHRVAGHSPSWTRTRTNARMKQPGSDAAVWEDDDLAAPTTNTTAAAAATTLQNKKMTMAQREIYHAACHVSTVICLASLVADVSAIFLATSQPVASLIFALSGTILLTLSCIALHAMYGAAMYVDSTHYALFMPFVGGVRFVIYQSVAWCCYTACVCITLIGVVDQRGSVLLFALLAVLGVSTQLLLLYSLPRFDPFAPEMARRSASGLLTALTLAVTFLFARVRHIATVTAAAAAAAADARVIAMEDGNCSSLSAATLCTTALPPMQSDPIGPIIICAAAIVVAVMFGLLSLRREADWFGVSPLKLLLSGAALCQGSGNELCNYTDEWQSAFAPTGADGTQSAVRAPSEFSTASRSACRHHECVCYAARVDQEMMSSSTSSATQRRRSHTRSLSRDDRRQQQQQQQCHRSPEHRYAPVEHGASVHERTDEEAKDATEDDCCGGGGKEGGHHEDEDEDGIMSLPQSVWSRRRTHSANFATPVSSTNKFNESSSTSSIPATSSIHPPSPQPSQQHSLGKSYDVPEHAMPNITSVPLVCLAPHAWVHRGDGGDICCEKDRSAEHTHASRSATTTTATATAKATTTTANELSASSSTSTMTTATTVSKSERSATAATSTTTVITTTITVIYIFAYMAAVFVALLLPFTLLLLVYSLMHASAPSYHFALQTMEALLGGFAILVLLPLLLSSLMDRSSVLRTVNSALCCWAIYSIPTMTVLSSLVPPVFVSAKGLLLHMANMCILSFLSTVPHIHTLVYAISVVCFGYFVQYHFYLCIFLGAYPVRWGGVCIDTCFASFWLWYIQRYTKKPHLTGHLYSPRAIRFLRHYFFHGMSHYFSFRIIVCDDVEAGATAGGLRARAFGNRCKDNPLTEPAVEPTDARAVTDKPIAGTEAAVHLPASPAPAMPRVDLNDPTNQYLFSFHPHGVFPGTLVYCSKTARWERAVGSNRQNFVSAHCADVVFSVPLQRELPLCLGAMSVCRTAIVNSIQSGNSPLIITGGQAEMLLTKMTETEMHLVCHHMGFVRIAMQYRIPLVPIISFGENVVMDMVHMIKVQRWCLKRIGLPFPVIPYGLWKLPLPLARRVTLVIGQPLTPLPGRDNVDDPECVYEMHVRYFEYLEWLFYRFRAEARYPNMELYLHNGIDAAPERAVPPEQRHGTSSQDPRNSDDAHTNDGTRGKQETYVSAVRRAIAASAHVRS